MTALKWLWSLVSGFSLQTYLIIAAVVAFAAWTVAVHNAGYDKADAMWKAKALESKIAKLELEKKVLEEAAELDAKFREELAEENEQQQKDIDAYAEELKNRPDKCLLGPDAERLQ